MVKNVWLISFNIKMIVLSFTRYINCSIFKWRWTFHYFFINAMFFIYISFNSLKHDGTKKIYYFLCVWIYKITHTYKLEIVNLSYTCGYHIPYSKNIRLLCSFIKSLHLLSWKPVLQRVKYFLCIIKISICVCVSVFVYLLTP